MRLPPGGRIRRVFDLTRLVTDFDPLPGGRWIVEAYWQNRKSGARLALEPPQVIGMVESEPITIRTKPW